MEYVNGETLKSIVAREGGLPEPRVRSNGVDLSSALEAAHAAGIIHRDVKLQNVLVAIDGTLKVTDFGIAASSLAQTQLTQVGSIIGTASYLSPEQALGQPATVRSDVYSAGVCLFEMATGVLPYAGQHAVEIANQHVHAPVPSARHLRRELSDDLDQIIQKAMAKDPNRRYASARSLRTALLRVPAPAPPTSSSASDQPAPTQVTTMTMSQQLGRRATSATRGRPSIAGRSRRGFLAGSALVVAAFLAVGILLTGGSALDGRGSSAVRHSVPPVWHQPLSKAQSTLRAAGFAPKVTTQDPNSDQARGTVLAQLPKAGTKLAKGATVALTVSTAPLRPPSQRSSASQSTKQSPYSNPAASPHTSPSHHPPHNQTAPSSAQPQAPTTSLPAVQPSRSWCPPGQSRCTETATNRITDTTTRAKATATTSRGLAIQIGLNGLDSGALGCKTRTGVGPLIG